MNAHDIGIEAAYDHIYRYLGGEGPDHDMLESAISAYLEASGMVMVPREPDGEMMRAGADASPMWDTGSADAYAIAVNDVADVYIAMIEAFPSPFSQANSEGEKA